MALGKISRGLIKPCVLLIVIAGVERLVFKGVASNLVTYLTDVMKMSNSSAAKFVNYWVGFTWIMPLAVASLADSKWDRYTTVLGFSFLYVAGLLALTLTSVQWLHHTKNNTAHSFSSLTTTLSLYIISLGQGGYNPSLQAFGADQIILEEDDDQKNKKSLFFQWWYFGVCSGSLLGVSVMSYVQDNLGWGLSFTVLTLSMLVSIIMFLLGNRFYKHGDEDRSSRDAASSRRSFRDAVRTLKGNTLLKMIKGYLPITTRDEDDHAVVEFELEEKPLCSSSSEEQKEENKEEDDDDVDGRKIRTLLPMWITLLFFAVIFQQPTTFFTKQGMTMKRDITGSFKIPPAALQSAITISIVVLMPLYDTVLVPLVTRLLLITGKEKGVSVIQRIGVGMFISVIAMAIAAVVERKRLERGGDGVMMSIFWLLPQYVLLGVSDIFTVVGMQEFFYSEASTRTMGIALYSSVFGVGSFLSALLISAIECFTRHHQSWFSDDMSKARLDKYYWLLSFSSAVSLLAFVLVFRGK